MRAFSAFHRLLNHEHTGLRLTVKMAVMVGLIAAASWTYDHVSVSITGGQPERPAFVFE